MSISVSAPGKLMLFGEHSVVYGYPCIVTTVDQRVYLTAEKIENNLIKYNLKSPYNLKFSKKIIELGNSSTPKEVEYIEYAISKFYSKFKLSSGLAITTHSDFSSKLGLGSSSAITVCTIKALGELFNIKLTNKDILKIAYDTIIDLKGVGSGYDIASAIYGGTIYYRKKNFFVKSIDLSNIPLKIVYSGIKAETPPIIEYVRNQYNNQKPIITDVFKLMSQITNKAVISIDKRDWKELGILMNINHGLLNSIGVSSILLEQLIQSIKGQGALGAKLSGAGIGDCLIYLSEKSIDEKISSVIKQFGGKKLDLKISVEGLRIEN